MLTKKKKKRNYKKPDLNKLGVCWKEKAVVPVRISSLTLEKKSSKRGRHDLTTRLVGTTQITGEAVQF